MPRRKPEEAAGEAEVELTPDEGQQDGVEGQEGVDDAQLIPPSNDDEPQEAMVNADKVATSISKSPTGEIVVKPVVVDKTKMRVVHPRKGVPSVRIGKHYYSFTVGKPVKVPEDICQHLSEKGII